MSALPIIFLLIIIGSLYLYKGASCYDLFEVTAFNEGERSLLYKMHIYNESVLFLNGITNEAVMPMQVIVEDCCIKYFQEKLKAYGVEYNHIELKPRDEIIDVNEKYDNSYQFLHWQSITSWVNTKQRSHHMLKKQILAITYEKREVFTLSLTKNKNNPIVVIVGGEQGKDWMSIAIIIALIDMILEDKQLKGLIEYFTFYFIPIMNPDGYVYSIENNEFWTKNRRVFFPKRKCHRQIYSDDNTAVGVNIDRNWYYVNVYNTQEDICNAVYLGHRALSEEETNGLAVFLNKHANKLMAFINVIGYGNRLITLPYANTMQHSVNHGVMMDIITSACERLQNEHNTTYFNGQSAKFFCNCADWVKYKLNVPIVYTVYMKYKDETIPNPKNIISLSQQLGTILDETLQISKEIYGPLFNSQQNMTNTLNLLLLIISIHHYL